MPELEPLPAPHDCEERYDRACPVCREDDADEPDSPNGIIVVEEDGTKRAANAEEAADWAAAIVERGVLPATDPAVMLARGMEPAHDCDDEFSPTCVDACAEPCQCGCNPGLTPPPSRASRVLVRVLRFVLWVILPAALGAFVGACLTLTEAAIGAACLVGFWALWKSSRP